MPFIRGTTQQRSALMETQGQTWPRTWVPRMTPTCVTHKNLASGHPGLQLTMALQSQSKGWRSLTEEIVVDGGLTTLTCASQTSFLLQPTRCSLGALFWATLLDLLLMENISSSQVKCFLMIIVFLCLTLLTGVFLKLELTLAVKL